MRHVTITRKKSFVGALIPYFIFIGYPRTELDPLDPEDTWEVPEQTGLRIENGQTVSMEIPDGPCTLSVMSMTSTGAAGGPAYFIDAGIDDVDLELVTQYSLLSGSRYILRPV